MIVAATRRLALLVLVIATVGCDQVTKHYASTTLAQTPTRSFLRDTFRLDYAENAGAFLSLGADWSPEVRTILLTAGNAILLLAVVLSAMRGRLSGVGLSGSALFVAGGVSNLIDRLIRGSVIDFMNVGIGSLRTGIFNVADMAILLGLAMLVFARHHDATSEKGVVT